MINWDKINKKISVNKVVMPVFIILLIVVLISYIAILKKQIKKNVFAYEMEQVAKKNENPIFSVEKIYICSSATAIDNTAEQKLDNLSIYQYTDIALYINNSKQDGLTDKNTVKELYIDNINLDLDYNIGQTSLVYTNLLKIGSKEELKDMIFNSRNNLKDRIDFKIINTNEENSMANYENPSFYADCSNPISLKYINQINREYSVGVDNSATFDGSILQKAGIKPEDIGVKIRFKINLVNNEGEYFSDWINFKVPFNDIYKGTSIKMKNTTGREYNFFTL